MDPQLAKDISSLIGCLYFVPPLSPEDSSSSSSPHLNAFRFSLNPSLPSTSSASSLLHISHPQDARLMARAVHIGFACLIGDNGESLVASTPILARMQNPNMPYQYPQFMISYPAYSNRDGVCIPLVFPAEIAYFAQKCELCIMRPLERPFLSTRCLDLSSDELIDVYKNPVFCFFYSDSERDSYVVDGSISLPFSSPESYGLIAEFGLALSLRAGIVTNAAGRIIGTHVCDFTIEEGDDAPGWAMSMSRRTHVVGKVEIKDNVEPSMLSIPTSRIVEGMPFSLLKQVQDRFSSYSKRGKASAQQSRIYLMSEASKRLFFFNKRSSLLSSLTYLMVRNEDMHDNRSLWLLPRRDRHMNEEHHKRKKLWHVDGRSRRVFVYYDEDEEDDTKDCSE